MSEPVEMNPVEDPKIESNEPATDGSDKKCCDCKTGATLYVFLMLSATAICVAGMCVSWIFSLQSSRTDFIYLWQWTTVINGQETIIDDSGLCDDMGLKMKWAQVLASVTVACSFLGAAAIIIKHFIKIPAIFWVAIGFAGASLAASIVAWAIMLRIFSQQSCGNAELKSAGFNLGPGFWCYVVVSILSAAAGLLYWADFEWPSSKEKKRQWANIIFLACAGLATIGICVGTPIAWFKYRTLDLSGGITQVSEVSLWTTFSLTGVQTNNRDIGCNHMDRYFMAAQASAVLSVLLILVTLLFAILRFFGKLGSLLILIFGWITSLTTTVTLSLGLTVYYTQFCDGRFSLDYQRYVITLGAGFFFGSAALLVFGSLVQSYVAYVTRHEDSEIRIFRFLYIFILVWTTTYVIVGLSMPWFRKKYEENGNFWRLNPFTFQSWDGTTFTSQDMSDWTQCVPLQRHLKAAAAFALLAIVLLLVALLFAILTISKPNIRFHGALITLIASVSLLISWALGVASYTEALCDSILQDQTYFVAEGLSLMIGAWFMSLFMAIGNMLLA